MHRFIAQMIGRNEAHRYLREVLEHLVPQVDKIVFTDDASQDATPDLFAEFGAHVYRNSAPLFSVHEGRLRQSAWENLAHHAQTGDWILSIDCDERLYATDPDQPLSSLLQTTQYHALEVMFYHMWSPEHYRADKGWAPSPQPRIFRYADHTVFADSALACGSGPEYVRLMELTGKVRRGTGLVMQHLGYMREEDRLAKHELYMRIDGGKYHVLDHIQSIADPNPTLVKWQPLRSVP